MIIKLFHLFSISILLFSVDLIGQIKTKDGLKINLYFTGSKKPLSMESMKEGITGTEGSYMLEKIVISGIKDLYSETGLKLKVYKVSDDETRELLLSKDLDIIVFNGKNKTYSLPILPWIDIYGNYKILIESGKDVILDLSYDMFLPSRVD